jgi:hypothetical protein
MFPAAVRKVSASTGNAFRRRKHVVQYLEFMDNDFEQGTFTVREEGKVKLHTEAFRVRQLALPDSCALTLGP